MANPSIVTRDIEKFSRSTGNVYKSLAIVENKSKFLSFTKECLSLLLLQLKNFLKTRFYSEILRRKKAVLNYN